MAVLSRLRRQARLLYEPAPMAEFEDFDEYWERRGTIPVVFHRWVVAARLLPQGARILDLGMRQRRLPPLPRATCAPT